MPHPTREKWPRRGEDRGCQRLPSLPLPSRPPPPSPSLALVLQPLEYEALAPHHPLYATYIFLPSLGVFVHPLAIPPETMVPPQQLTKCTLATFSNNNRVESSSSSSMVPTNKTSSSMVPTNKTEAG